MLFIVEPITCVRGRIQDFGMGGTGGAPKARVSRRRSAERVGFGEGVSLSPMGLGSGEGAVPPPHSP